MYAVKIVVVAVVNVGFEGGILWICIILVLF